MNDCHSTLPTLIYDIQWTADLWFFFSLFARERKTRHYYLCYLVLTFFFLRKRLFWWRVSKIRTEKKRRNLLRCYFQDTSPSLYILHVLFLFLSLSTFPCQIYIHVYAFLFTRSITDRETMPSVKIFHGRSRKQKLFDVDEIGGGGTIESSKWQAIDGVLSLSDLF